MYVYIYMYIKWWIGCSTQTILTVYQHSLIGNVRIIYLIYPLLPKMVYRNIIFPTNLCVERNFRFRKNCLRIVYVEHAFPYFHFGCYFHPIPRISVVRTSPSPHDEGETRSKWDRRPLGVGCNVCSRKNARGQAEIGVSSWNGRKRFHRGSLLRAVMVTGCRSFCNRCVQLRRLALPRTANRYSAPETGSTLRRRRGRD